MTPVTRYGSAGVPGATPGTLFFFQDGITLYKPWLILIFAQQVTEKMKEVFSAVGWAFSLGKHLRNLKKTCTQQSEVLTARCRATAMHSL
jgi:hypothetical protein